jgi:hypothetical protein
MALSATQRPFIFEKIQGLVGACESTLQTALQPNYHWEGPWNIVQRHIFLLSATNDPDKIILLTVARGSRPEAIEHLEKRSWA